MTTPRVTDVDTVEVGKFYMVQHGLVDHRRDRSMGDFRGIGWVPLLGPHHADAEIINFHREHYHYDWRFVPEAHLRFVLRFNRSPLSLVELDEDVTAIAWKRRKCVRPMPVFELRGTWHGKLENAYASVRLKPDCRTCPHRGVPLNGMPVENGATICAGHGLAWNLATGEMARRVKRTTMPIGTE